jgi:hypothetical protein
LEGYRRLDSVVTNQRVRRLKFNILRHNFTDLNFVDAALSYVFLETEIEYGTDRTEGECCQDEVLGQQYKQAGYTTARNDAP